MKHTIIVTGYNCEKYAKECLDSLINQDYDKRNYEVIVYNDGSTDDTASVLEPYTDSFNVTVWNNPTNEGALFGRYKCVRFAKGEIVSFVGLDDKLSLDALKTLDRYYEEGVLMTWGTWQTFKGYAYPAQQYPKDVWESKSFRRASWKATALNTFKRELLLRVPEEVLKHEGKFFTNCTDLAYSFPCLEMIEEENTRVIKEPIYIYRHNHTNTTRQRLGKADKTRVREILKNIPKCL